MINLNYEWLDGAVADVSGTPIINRDHRLSGELGLGGSYSSGDDRFTLDTEVSGDTAIADFGAGYNLKGTAGLPRPGSADLDWSNEIGKPTVTRPNESMGVGRKASSTA